ncbi:hypothetical protein V1508DRAFT_420172 [Lipomyces doorenjongii]|uniref:uncharacterized protein n=1 Tax=Lipomyces doorenjongii TaxID=383834 RepID=UPI0034CD4C68
MIISLSMHLLDHILPLGSTTTKAFDGDYANSSKQPDGGIRMLSTTKCMTGISSNN